MVYCLSEDDGPIRGRRASARQIHAEAQVGNPDGQTGTQRLVAGHADGDRTDSVHPARWSLEPFLTGTAEDVCQEQRVAAAVAPGALLDLDVLGHLPVALEGEPLASDPARRPG